MKFRIHVYGKSGLLKALPLLLVVAVAIPCVAQSVPLVTGKSITYPPLGTQVNVGSLPTNMILSPDGKFAIVSDGGFDQSLTAIATSSGSVVSSIVYDNCNFCDSQTTNGLYYGIAFGANGTLYAAQGGNNTIDVLSLGSDGTLTDLGSFPATQPTDFPSGLATDSRGYLYVANNDPATPFLPGSVAIYSQATQKEVGRYSFTQSYFGTPNFPLAIVTLADGSKTYVASERDGAIYALNTSDPTKPTLISGIATGANPDGLLLNQTQTLLYVANGGSDTVTVIRTADDVVLGSVLLRPGALRHVAGSSTPTGLGLSPDGSTLYVALGDLNAIAVLAVHGSKLSVEGYIPAGWYPSAVVSASQNTILFANAKGTTPYYPNPDYVQWAFNASHDYDQHLIQGQVSLVTVDNDNLSELTDTVIANNAPQSDRGLEGIGRRNGGIKHVIYIVKENRTYDQVLGDIAQGNGDPSLTLFGQSVTPNLHALTQRFVLLDNVYTSGEVSYDGWVWSTQAIADEQLIKAAPYNYSGRGHNYNAEGQNNGYLVGGFPAKDPDGNLLSPVYFPNGAPPIPDITQGPGGHIWDAVEAAHLTYRNYGFFYSFGVSDGNGNVVFPDNYPGATGLLPPGHDLAGVSDFDYRRYDNNYADSEGPSHYGCPYPTASYGKYTAVSRYSEWAREFNEFLQKDPTGNSVPAFMTVRFPHDHTQGPFSGHATPAAEVADNDYGVGQFVQAISQSPIWKNTAIFVIEDDSQDGPDHVDAHRTTAYVISPWIKQGAVDHTFYTTGSMLKTIEGLLGLKPLTSYDATANPILDWDSKPRNATPYTATLPAQSVVCAITPSLKSLNSSDPRRDMIMQAGTMDTDNPDSAPPRRLNDLIWKSVKGPDSQPPAPKHTISSPTQEDND